MATQAQCAKHLFVSERTFRKYIKAGAIKTVTKNNGYRLGDVREQYLTYLRNKVSGQSSDGDGSTLDKERTRRAKSLADKAEIEVAEMRNQLVPVDQVENAMMVMVSAMKTRLLAIPTTTAPLLGTSNIAATEKIIREQVCEALQELASTTVVGNNT